MGRIIAIVGMCGSGKSIASDMLEKLNFKKVYFGGVTFEKLEEANMEINQENERYMREKLRCEYGIGAYASILLPKIKELSTINDVVLDGLYSWDELKILKDEFGEQLSVIAIVSDKMIRYNRLSNREIRPFSFEEAKKRDISEIENIAKGGPIAYADYYINNNYDINTYKKRLLEILNNINKEDFNYEEINR